jgi:hypothetical protein
MKRKGHREIPDFSKKQPATAHTPATKVKMAPPPAPMRGGKPQATSVKAGQRGQ